MKAERELATLPNVIELSKQTGIEFNIMAKIWIDKLYKYFMEINLKFSL